MEPDRKLIQSREIWSCLGCGNCSQRCPVGIDFNEFISFHRQEARKDGNLPQESHHSILQLVTDLQTRNVKQRRTAWASKAGSFKDSGEYFYFVGCQPYFDVTFRYMNLSPLDTGRSVLKLLNVMGVEPVISNDERCCGHDALWSGNKEVFLKLARWNLAVIKSSGAKTVLFSCPEGYFTFKNQYPKYFGELPFEVLHMTEYLARELPKINLSFNSASDATVTYHDPCRLGRLAGIYEAPRQLLQLIPDIRLVEMERNRENALCCGTSAWMECSNCSKAIQNTRLLEAMQTGAQTLVTTCPKCQIHFQCAQSGSESNFTVADLYTYLYKHLDGAGAVSTL
jgi:Fe-S oxidoreductase